MSKVDHEAHSASLHQRLADLRRDLGTQLVSDEQVRPAPGIASQWAPLDSFVVGGGWPRGELSLVEAPWGYGAATLIAGSMASLTQRGQAVAWVHSDSRLRLNPAGLAKTLGLKWDALLCVHTPRDTREQERRAAWAWQEILATRAFALVVLDLRRGTSASPTSLRRTTTRPASDTNSLQHQLRTSQLRSDDSARGQEAFPASRASIDCRVSSSTASSTPLRATEVRQILAQARRSGAALILITDPFNAVSPTDHDLDLTANPYANKEGSDTHAVTANLRHLSTQQLHQAAALALRIERREVWITRAQHRPTPHRIERSYAHVEAFLEPVDPRLVLCPRDRNRPAPDRSARLRGVAPALLPAADLSID